MRQSQNGSMAGRTVLVTGASGGIGKATAVGLARMGAHVAVTGRDVGRVEAAVREVRAAGGGEVLAALPRIDVLINNVGGFWDTRHVTADGLERTIALNHLAPFLLTNLLLDRLVAGAPARVVTVASNAQALSRIGLDDLQGEHGTPVRGPTTSPSWPMRCSVTNSHEGSQAAWPRPTPCTPAWWTRGSGPKSPASSSACLFLSCGP